MQDSAQASLQVPRRRTGLQVRTIGDETVVLDPQSERMHNLNSTAAFIFESIDGERTIRQIAKDLADCFQIELMHAERDTHVLIAQLRELSIID